VAPKIRIFVANLPGDARDTSNVGEHREAARKQLEHDINHYFQSNYESAGENHIQWLQSSGEGFTHLTAIVTNKR